MDRESLRTWLDAYGRAWIARDAKAAAALYADDGTYQVLPFEEALRGREAIFQYWVAIAKTEEKIHFGYEILAVTPDQGIARWGASLCACRPACRRSWTASS